MHFQTINPFATRPMTSIKNPNHEQSIYLAKRVAKYFFVYKYRIIISFISLAIVGSSGSGKTTLAGLIPRFHDPGSGQIRLNGTPLQEYTLESLRTGIGIVSQDAFLFNTSIAENIAYGQKGIDPETIRQAAKAAYAHNFIKDLPQGYETIVGERGVKLSGGQKQRLTIARAILKNPSLLILDEATSALDTESEAIVQKALDNLMQGRSSIVIAHRLSTVIGADRIVVMDKGEIVDAGRHGELLKRCAIYANLYRIQFANEKNAAPEPGNPTSRTH